MTKETLMIALEAIENWRGTLHPLLYPGSAEFDKGLAVAEAELRAALYPAQWLQVHLCKPNNNSNAV